MADTFTYIGVDFDITLHQFGLDFIGIFAGNAIENRGIFAAQSHGVGIDQSQFYFHAEGGLITGIKFKSGHGKLHSFFAMERNS